MGVLAENLRAAQYVRRRPCAPTNNYLRSNLRQSDLVSDAVLWTVQKLCDLRGAEREVDCHALPSLLRSGKSVASTMTK
jgi:hypothetical protein